jgi:hypothetical protein
MPRQSLSEISKISDIFDRWPTARAAAEDIERELPPDFHGPRVTRDTIIQWRHHNRLPARYWAALVKAGKRRRVGVTHDALARFEQQRYTR